MFYYRIFNKKIESEYELTAMQVIEKDEDIDIRIHAGKIEQSHVVQEEKEDKNPYRCYYTYQENWAHIHFPIHGDFVIQNGNEISYQLREGYQREYVEQVLLCYCLTILLLQRKEVLIHGSAIDWNGKTLIISGDSGAGKSTLTEQLLGTERKFLSDDIVDVTLGEEVLIQPSFPLRKLCEDAALTMKYDLDKLWKIPDPERTKYAIRQEERYQENALGLGAMVIIKIGQKEQVKIHEITGAEKIKYLSQNLFRQDVYAFIGLQQRTFMQCVKIANSMPIYVIERPEGKMTVKEQAQLVEQVLNW